ncbi:MAG TPA: hypothetical protein DIT48_10275 [Actinobacteria bacterium]|nr:hypothetical protein [Actinomycetota bacterium]HCP62806.1 hypothetical protein [Actinomycetota bacterium]
MNRPTDDNDADGDRSLLRLPARNQRASGIPTGSEFRDQWLSIGAAARDDIRRRARVGRPRRHIGR